MDPLAPLIASLHADGRPRVWSLIVTAFGELAPDGKTALATGDLLDLTGRIGIEAGAVRTALSRLAGEGWIEGEREGRRSRYRLTGRAVRETIDASRLIYAAPRPSPETWTLAISDKAPEGALTLGDGVFLTPGRVDFVAGVAGRLTGDPKEIGTRLLSAEHRAALDGLMADLEAVPSGDLAPLDAVATRILVIHRWRRLVLRFPDIPAVFLPKELGNPRKAVAGHYARLAGQSAGWGGAALQPGRFGA